MEVTLVSTVLVFSVLITLGGFILGGVVGWVSHSYYLEHFALKQSFQANHPEFYDSEGKIIPNQLLTVRFESEDEYFED